jgi:hypothetical protein
VTVRNCGATSWSFDSDRSSRPSARTFTDWNHVLRSGSKRPPAPAGSVRVCGSG